MELIHLAKQKLWKKLFWQHKYNIEKDKMAKINNINNINNIKQTTYQNQPSRGVLKKRCSENMQQIYRRTPMPKCDFNKVALQYLRTAASDIGKK